MSETNTPVAREVEFSHLIVRVDMYWHSEPDKDFYVIELLAKNDRYDLGLPAKSRKIAFELTKVLRGFTGKKVTLFCCKFENGEYSSALENEEKIVVIRGKKYPNPCILSYSILEKNATTT